MTTADAHTAAQTLTALVDGLPAAKGEKERRIRARMLAAAVALKAQPAEPDLAAVALEAARRAET